MKPLSAWSEELIDRLQFIQGDSILLSLSLSCLCLVMSLLIYLDTVTIILRVCIPVILIKNVLFLSHSDE